MKLNIAKKLILILFAIVLVVTMFACSPRTPEVDNGIDKGEPPIVDDINKIESLKKQEAVSLIKKSIENGKKPTPENADWYNIELSVDFIYQNYTTKPMTDIYYGITFKASFNLLDNSKSILFFELKDKIYNVNLFAIYYYQQATYINAGGNEYYSKEINVTEIGKILSSALGGIDIVGYIGGFLAGNMGIPDIDAFLPIIHTLLFDSTAQTRTYNKGKSQDVGLSFMLNSVLNMLKTGLPVEIAGIKEINWEALGLPNLDPILKQLFGTNLQEIKEKKWPKMTAYLNAITNIKDVTNPDGSVRQDYVFDGIGINIVTPKTDKQENTYYVDLRITPFKLEKSDKPLEIDFAGLNLGSSGQGNRYKDGGILNLDVDLSLFVENKQNGVMTINGILGNVLGDVLDIGEVGNIPIKMPTANSYEFDLNLKLDLDLFDNNANRIQFMLQFQQKQFIKGYLEGDTLYLDLSAISDRYGQIIPNIKLSQIDLTGVVFKGLLSSVMPYLDPTYVAPLAQANVNTSNEEGDITPAPVFDVMTLIKLLIGNLDLPGVPPEGQPQIISLILNNQAINQILAMFMSNKNIGLPGVSISIDQRDPLNSLKIEADLSDTISVGLKVKSFSYFACPEFPFANMVDTQEKKDSFTDIKDVSTFNAALSGEVSLGIEKTEGGLDLSGLVSMVADNILLNLGVTETANLTIWYEIKVNLNIIDLSKLELVVNICLPTDKADPFISIYYNGVDDTMYIDLSNFDVLRKALPALNFLGDLPKIKIPYIGLSALLGGNIEVANETNIFNALLISKDGYTVPSNPLDAVGEIMGSMFMDSRFFPKNEEGEIDSGSNILDIIGKVIDGINIDSQVNAMYVVINAQVLSVLMLMLGKTVSMPDVNAYVKLQLMNVGEDGYVKVHLAILDSANSGIEAIYFDLELIQAIKVSIGKQNIVEGFNFEDYKDLKKEILNGMNISLAASGSFSLKSTEKTYSNDLLDNLLSSLIKGLSLRFNVDGFSINLGFELKGNLSLTYTETINDGVVTPYFGIDWDKTDASIIISDLDAKSESKVKILGIYLKDGNIYLELDYFGVPNIGINNISSLLDGAFPKPPVVEEDKNQNPLKANEQDIRNSAHLYNLGAVGLQVWLAPDKVTINLTQDVIVALLASFGIKDLPVKIAETNLEINFGDGVSLSLDTGIEIFELKMALGGLKVSIDPDDRHNIQLPEGKDFAMTEDGLPKSLYVSIAGELSIKSEPSGDGENKNRVDLSPILQKLLGSADLGLFLDMLGVVDGAIYYTIEATIDFANIAKSNVHLMLQTKDGIGKKTILEAHFVDGNLYINTDIVGIGRVVIKDFGSLLAPTASKVSQTSPNRTMTGEEQAKTYLDIMFIPGGIGLSITKDVLCGIISGLGLDLAPYLEGIEFTIDAELRINPAELKLEFNINGITAGLNLNKVEVGFDRVIGIPEGDFDEVAEFKQLGISMGGSFKFSMDGNGDGIPLDYILKKLLGDKFNFGLLLKVLGDEFGGTIYYDIDAVLDITQILNLKIALRLTSAEKHALYTATGDKGYLGDVLAFYIIGQEDGTLNAYIDGHNIGIEKIIVRDISGLINGFTATGSTPTQLPLNQNGVVSQKDLLGAGIIISIASDKTLQSAPIMVNITTGAIYALFKSLGADIEPFLGSFGPWANIKIGESNDLLSLNIGLAELLKVTLTLGIPDVCLETIGTEGESKFDKILDGFNKVLADVAKDDYFVVNPADKAFKVKVGFNGTISANGEITDENSQIDLTNLLQTFLTNAEFGILINNLFKLDATIEYSFEAVLDIFKLAKGDFTGIEALLKFTVGSEVLSAYLTGGTLYADFSILNVGKIKVENIMGLITKNAPLNMTDALSELVKSAPNGDADKPNLNEGEINAITYISILLSNANGIAIIAGADVFAILLTALGAPGDVIKDAVNGILDVKVSIGDETYFKAEIKIATYNLAFEFDKINVNFRDAVISNPGFDKNEYSPIDENLSEIFVNLKLYFSWNMDDGSTFDFTDLMKQLGLNMGFDIAPVLSILGQLGTKFELDVSAKLNFGDILKSDLSIVMSRVDESGKLTKLLSIYYVDGNLYLDAECFNIQKVKINDAIEYFTKLFAPKPTSGNGEDGYNVGFGALNQDDAEGDINKVAAYINVNLSKEGLIATVGSTALFAILQLAGLELSKPITDGIAGVADINVVAGILTPGNLIEFSLLLNSIKDGKPVTDKAIELKLEISNNFRVELSPKVEDKIEAPVGFLEIDESLPTIGVQTQLEFLLGAGIGSIEDLNKEPLKSLLGGYLTDLILTISLQIKGDQELKIVLDILGNINVNNIVGAELQIVISKANEDGTKIKLAQVNIFDGDMFVDLTLVGGPKFCIEEVMETILGLKPPELVSPTPVQQLPSIFNVGRANSMGIKAQITEAGLFIFVQKAAFDVILGSFNLNPIEMFDNVDAQVYFKPSGNTVSLGLELTVGNTTQNNLLKIGFGLNGLRVNFEPFDRDTLITPQSSNYLKAHNINTLTVETKLLFSLQATAGKINFGALLKELLSNSELSDSLLNTLPNEIIMEGIGETIAIDLSVILSLKDILGGLQIRAKIYSVSHPDKFSMDLAYVKGDIYIDASMLGLEKVKINDVMGIFASLMPPKAGESSEKYDRVVNIQKLYKNEDESLETAKEKLLGTIGIIVDKEDGIFVNIAQDMILAIFTMLNVDLGKYIDDVVKPEISLNLTNELSLKINIALKSALAGDLGALEMGLELIGSQTKIGVANEIIYSRPGDTTGTTIKPLISKEEDATYLPYYNLTIWTKINMSLDVSFKEGRLNIDEILNLIIAGMQTQIAFTEDHKIRVTISGEIGIDFAKLLSRDYDQINESIVGKFLIGYEIYEKDSSEPMFKQTAIEAYLSNGKVYLIGEIFDSHVKLAIEEFNIPQLIAGFLAPIPASDKDKEVVPSSNYNGNPYDMLRALGNPNSPDKLRSVVNLGGQGLSLVITNELLSSLIGLIGLEGVDVSSLLNDVIDGGAAGVYFDDGFALKITFEKKQPEPNPNNYAGYDFELSLLHDTKISLDPKIYKDFYQSINNPTQQAYFNSFNTISTINNRLTVGLRTTLSADLKEFILDWSGLFRHEINKNTAFYIKIAEAMAGEVILDIKVDLDFMRLDKLALDAVVKLTNADGGEILTLYFKGNLNQANWSTVGPQVYMTSKPLGIDGIILDASVFSKFIALDLLKILGDGIMNEPSNGGGSSSGSSKNAEGDPIAPSKPSGNIDFSTLLDSIAISKGKIAIVVARTAIASILSDLLGFPFDEIGNLSAELDLVNNTLTLDLALDVPESGEDYKLKFAVEIGSVDVSIGANNILPDEAFFSSFVPFDNYKWEIEVNSELAINDELGGLFDLTQLSSGLVDGLGLAIQSGEELNIKIGFQLKVFIDFSDFSKINLQLGITYNGKVMAVVTYIGSAEKGNIYLNLSGLALPNVELEGINLGTIVKDLLGSIVPQQNNTAPDANYASSTDMSSVPDIEDVPFGTPLLMLLISSKEVSLAITGALASSLVTGLNLGFSLPEFHSLKIGYSPEDDLAGLLLVLTADSPYNKSFRIGYNFLQSYSKMGTTVNSSITPFTDINGDSVKYEDISVIGKLSFALDMELRLRTRKANGEKSDQLRALEAMIEGLLGASENAVNLETQDSIMVFGLSLNVYLDLANLKQTSLSLVITYAEDPIMSVYYLGAKNAVYADLSGVGLFQAEIAGVDLMSFISGLLGGYLTPGKGLDLENILGGMFPGSSSSSNAPQNVQNASQTTTTGKTQALIRIILGNEDITIVPNAEVLSLLLPGFNLPKFTDIRISMRTIAGFNNLNLSLKIDNLGNNVSIIVPENGLRIAIGSSAKPITIPNTANYGAITGISIAEGSPLGLNVVSLASGLMDSIKMSSLQIYLDRRNDYWTMRDLGSNYKKADSWSGIKQHHPDAEDAGYNQSEFFTNQYRRMRLTIDKTSSNKIQILASQLTQLDENGNPMEAIIFIRDHILKLSLHSALILDLGPIIGNIVGAIVGAIFGGSYANPLRLGAIIDSIMNGGIELARLYLPSMLGTATPEYVGLGSLYGTVASATTGNPIKNVTVNVGSYSQVTDKDGKYSFINIPMGNYVPRLTADGYFSQFTSEVTITDGKTNSAQKLDVLLRPLESSIKYEGVGFGGKITNSAGGGIGFANIYIDNDLVATTNTSGFYNIVKDMYGEKHEMFVQASGYTIQEATRSITISASNENITQDFVGTLVPSSTGTITVKLIEKVTVAGVIIDKPIINTEVWLKQGTTTIKSWPDSQVPKNFAYGVTSSEGVITISGLAYGTYEICYRSTTHDNKNGSSVTITAENSYVNVGTVILTPRAHWSLEEPAVKLGMLQKVRIRLGADKLDGNNTGDSTDPGYNDDGAIPGGEGGYTPDTNTNNGYEGGATDKSDNVSYIELWLSPDIVSMLFGMVHGFLLPMMGMAPVTADQRHNYLSLSNTNYRDKAVFNEERSLEYYNFIHKTKGNYIQAAQSAGTKMAGGLIHFGLSGIFGTLSDTIVDLINGVAGSLLKTQVYQGSKLISHLVPFTSPYSLSGNIDMAGNPLAPYEDYVKGNIDDAIVRDENGNIISGTMERVVNNFDLSVHVKITLNNNHPETRLDRITLFINGASYVGAKNGILVDQNGNGKPWIPNATTIVQNQSITNGVVDTALEKEMQAWIKKNNVNSYLVIDDYKYEVNADGEEVKTLWTRTYIRDVYANAKDDHYQEIDIKNTGIRLRVAKTLSDQFFNIIPSGDPMQRVAMNPPSRIVFHDPYDLSDFSMYQGTWANEEGGRRRNTDPSKTIFDYLPNRNLVSFTDGSSIDSSGAYVYWDMTSIKFTAEGTDFNSKKAQYYLTGYCLNQVYGRDTNGVISKIRVDMDPLIVDPTKVDALTLPAIDPTNFDETAYMQNLPEQFTYIYDKDYILDGQFQEKEVGKTLIFNKLTWDLSSTQLTYKGGKQHVNLTYSFIDYNKNESFKTTIKVPVDVLDRTITSVNSAVEDSENGIVDSNISFNPLVNTNPKASMEALKYLDVTTPSGTIESWIIDSKDTSQLDNFDALSLNHPAYKVKYFMRDALDNVQEVIVNVNITSRVIKETSLPEQVNITPFNNEGLQLKDNIEVTYQNGSTETLTRGVHFEYEIPKMVFDFEETEFKDYTVNAIFGKDKSKQTVKIIYHVEKRLPTVVSNIIISPYGESRIDNNQKVIFNNGIINLDAISSKVLFKMPSNVPEAFTSTIKTIDGVDYHTDIQFTNPAFNGTIFFTDVALNDPIFGTAIVTNVAVIIKSSTVSQVNLPEHSINQYNSTQEITDLLNNDSVTLSIHNVPNSVVTKEDFKILGWKYSHDGGLRDDGLNSTIVVTVGNIDGTGKVIWQQEVEVSLTVPDRTIISIEDTITIADPYEFTMPTTLTAYLNNGETMLVPVTFFLGEEGETFYQKNQITVSMGARMGSMSNNYSYFDITLINQKPRADVEITYLDGTGNEVNFNTAINAFDNFTLPTKAKVKFKSTNEVLTLDVNWTDIGEYTAEGGTVTANAWIGNAVFGYIKDTVHITILAENIVQDSLPDVIAIDPYLDVKTQLDNALNNYKTFITNLRPEGVVLDIRYPEITLSYGAEKSYKLSFEVGTTTNFGTVGKIGEGVDNYGFDIRQKIEIEVIVLERLAVGTTEQLVGSVYDKIDFSKHTILNVEFKSGNNKEMDVVWDTSNLIYNFIGGVFSVDAIIFQGHPTLQQRIPVNVTINPSSLVNLGAEASDIVEVDGNGNIVSLNVDPLKGFVGLPTKAIAKFFNTDSTVELDIEWSYQHILKVMSVSGGDFNKENNSAAQATIYITVNGVRTARQSIEIPVVVQDRHITEVKVSKETDGNNDDYQTFSDKLTINPYVTAYSEDFNSKDFAYYRKVMVTLADGSTVVYPILAKNYQIFDEDTKQSTYLTNLYKGRKISATFKFGDETKGIAGDAIATYEIKVTIQDMSYASGLKNKYDIDVYGARSGYDKEVKYNQDEELYLTSNDNTSMKFAVKYDDKDINTKFDPITGKAIGKIGYTEGTARLYARYGNEMGGIQTVIIPVNYQDCKVDQLLSGDIKNYVDYNGNDGVVSKRFEFDPFKPYDKVTSYPASAPSIIKTGDTTITFTSSIKWDSSAVYDGYIGGNYIAVASIGEGNTLQSFNYPVHVLNRRVKVGVDENGNQLGFSNIFKGGVNNYVIKPYDFNQEYDLANKLTSKIFLDANAEFTVNFEEGESIKYRMGGIANNSGGTDITLGDDEQGHTMSFSLDTAMSLTHTGKNVRFFMTIPGYGMGKSGQQKAPIYVKTEEQVILGIKEVSSNGVVSEFKFNEGSESSISKDDINPNTYNVTDPYFFIKAGGIQLPERIRIYVGSKNGTIDTDKYYDIEPYWTNSSSNRVKVTYTGGKISLGFRMELDNQFFGIHFNVTPWILDNATVFSETNRYSKDEILLLPTVISSSSKNAITIKGLNSAGKPTEDYGYTFNFGANKNSSFDTIRGGGTSLDNYNKWSFEGVNFDSNETQYATLTLGGKGGQTIRWGFNVSRRHLINNSILNNYAILVGETITFPTTYTQYFSNDAKSNPIDVTFSNFKAADSQGSGITYNASNRQMGASKPTPANYKDDKDSYPATIEWDATSLRAYPDPRQSIGGKIYLTAYSNYDGAINNTRVTAYMYHPDSPNGYSNIRPGVDYEWGYPSSLSSAPGNNDAIGTSNYYIDSNSTGLKQNQVPIIKMLENAKFNTSYLPIFSINRYYPGKNGIFGIGSEPPWDHSYYNNMPWQAATVYYTDKPLNSNNWNHSTGTYGTKVANGIAGISSSTTLSGVSRVGGRYTLVATFDGIQNGYYTVIVAIDIVRTI